MVKKEIDNSTDHQQKVSERVHAKRKDEKHVSLLLSILEERPSSKHEHNHECQDIRSSVHRVDKIINIHFD